MEVEVVVEWSRIGDSPGGVVLGIGEEEDIANGKIKYTRTKYSDTCKQTIKQTAALQKLKVHRCCCKCIAPLCKLKGLKQSQHCRL